MSQSTSDPKVRFIGFLAIIIIGFGSGYLLMRKGFSVTPESFKTYVQSLGSLGPIMYIGLFTFRPLLFISSIALFVAGGLAFGPVLGPVYAVTGASLGGSLAFLLSRIMGHEFIISKIKAASDILKNTSFNFSVVFFLTMIPITPLSGICYGAGLSYMTLRGFVLAHTLGLIPRAFAFGFFGSTLVEIGSSKFLVAGVALLLLILITIYFRYRTKSSG
jgi:uncharacterized membrane protein YdjX (TVP38/TMEM64 family)